METTTLLFGGGALVVLVAGAATDLRTRRIPNALTFGGALAGLVANLLAYQLDGIRWSLIGWLVGVLLLAIPFALRGTGAGDVKLLAAVGAWAGPWFAVYTLVFGAIAGGVVALGLLLTHRQLGVFFRPVVVFLRHWATLAIGLFAPRVLAPAAVSGSARCARAVERTVFRFPYAPALAIGGLLTVLLR